MPPTAQRAPVRDVVVAGAGVVGLTAALALARRGARVTLIGTHRPGEASPAAAGMLAPLLERADTRDGGRSAAFAIAARDGYAAYLATLREESDLVVPHNDRGILEVVLDAAPRVTRGIGIGRAGTAPPAPRARPSSARSSSPRSSSARSSSPRWLDRAAVAALEPGLSHTLGATHYPRDGAVDTRALLRALQAALRAHPGISHANDSVRAFEFSDDTVICHTLGQVRYSAHHAVLAAGAWAPMIDGLPRILPIEPVRGQILALGNPPDSAGSRSRLRHVVYGPGGYLVPRESGDVLVGSTMERAGFDASTTDSAQAELHAVAAALYPPLARAPTVDCWAGLRPVTPDLLPILGRDPVQPALVYACGHSRNGILLAPLSGECVAALIAGETPPADISPFSISRFATTADE